MDIVLDAIQRIVEIEEALANVNGKDGVDGKDGRDGIDGKDGADGKDGKDGRDGKDGKDGIDGKDGKDGRAGKDGITTTVVRKVPLTEDDIIDIARDLEDLDEKDKLDPFKALQNFQALIQPRIVAVGGGGGSSSSGDTSNKMDIDGLNSNVTKLRFNTTPTLGTVQIGETYFDETNHTLSTKLSANVTLQHGQEVQIYVRNNSGAPIPNGAVVYQTGVIGGHPTIALAIATSESTTYPLAVATEDIADNDWGYCTTFGKVRDLNTNALNENDELFLSATVAGEYTTTPPASPNYVVKIGSVTVKNPANGEILVNIHNPLSNNTSLSGNSQKLSATEYAIKTYIDNNTGGGVESGYGNNFLLMGA